MTEKQPAKAGPQIPHQRRPSRTPSEAKASPHHSPPPKKKSKTDLAIEEAVAALVASAPPLSPEQRTRLAELFSINHNHNHNRTSTSRK